MFRGATSLLRATVQFVAMFRAFQPFRAGHAAHRMLHTPSRCFSTPYGAAWNARNAQNVKGIHSFCWERCSEPHGTRHSSALSPRTQHVMGVPLTRIFFFRVKPWR